MRRIFGKIERPAAADADNGFQIGRKVKCNFGNLLDINIPNILFIGGFNAIFTQTLVERLAKNIFKPLSPEQSDIDKPFVDQIFSDFGKFSLSYFQKIRNVYLFIRIR